MPWVFHHARAVDYHQRHAGSARNGGKRGNADAYCAKPLRFGHFEHFYYRREPDKVRQLADFAIRHHWAHLQDEADKYVLWFRDVVARTASLIARWQTVGFAHGVMNTDNMSILGLTFDYGPFGFLDDYQPGYICNHSDYQGRYSFDNQPAVGLWNLQRLAQTLSPFIDVDALNDALDSYQDILLREYGTLMRNKLGLMTQEKGDNDILNGLFALMAREGSDYTRTFRMLGQTEQHSAASPLRDEFIDRQAFDDWFALTARGCSRSRWMTPPDADERDESRDGVAQLAGAAGD
jgi:uncharacterized protein YdiU (UPF0061 family)